MSARSRFPAPRFSIAFRIAPSLPFAEWGCLFLKSICISGCDGFGRVWGIRGFIAIVRVRWRETVMAVGPARLLYSVFSLSANDSIQRRPLHCWYEQALSKCHDASLLDALPTNPLRVRDP